MIQRELKRPSGWSIALGIAFLTVTAGPLFQPIFGDEIPIIRNILRFVQDRTIIPTQFSYPTFYSYFLTAVFAVPSLVLTIVLGLSPTEIGLRLSWPVYGTAAVNLELFLLRLSSLVVGLATLWMTFLLARSCCERRFGSGWKVVGFVAAACVAFSHTFVYRATLILPDVLLTLLTVWVLRLAVDAFGQDPARPVKGGFPPVGLIGAAALGGVATATKYNGGFALIAVFLVLWVWHVRRVRDEGGIRALANPSVLRRVLADHLLLGGVTAAAFLAGTPGWLFVPSDFWGAFLYERQHMMEGQLFVDWGEYTYAWIPMRFVQVENAIGVLFIAGVVWTLLRGGARGRLILAPILMGMCFVGLWRYTSLHYLLWTFPGLGILAGAALLDIVQRLKMPRARLAVAVIALLAVVPNFVRLAADSITWMTRESNLLVAERWIESNIPAATSIHQNWYGLPTIWDLATKERYLTQIAAIPDASAEFSERIANKPYFEGYLGYQIQPPSAEQLQQDRPEWVVINTLLKPPTPEPLRGYRATALDRLHARLAGYHAQLDSAGDYALYRVFRSGAGPAVLLYRRIEEPR